MKSIQTTELNTGITVLAKPYKDSIGQVRNYAVTYSNRTQATNKETKLRQEGVPCDVVGTRPFYIRINRGN